MSIELILPMLMLSLLFLFFVALVVIIVVIIKRNSLKKEDGNEINIDLRRRIETLEKEIRDIKNK